jgi:prepilin-type N-terminal cleavage/methylation domain-containing protein
MSARMDANGITLASNRGFTLVELVMTLLIVGILAVFAISRLDFTRTFGERAYLAAHAGVK